MTTKTDETYTMTEKQMKDLARNALMVAGNEMGKEGDHWPVIKNTITDIMMDWEHLEREREVHAEMKIHLYEQLDIMKENLKNCTLEEKKIAAPLISELEEIYDAFFTEVKMEEIYMAENDDEVEEPVHIKRAEAILNVLMEENDD